MIAIVLCICICISLAQADDAPIVGLNAPVEGQRCVSIKFPWKEREVYFCTKDESFAMLTCPYPGDDDSCWKPDEGESYVSIKAPWLCCPEYIFTEDCKPEQCSAPYNRSCQEVLPKGTCCMDYYCGIGEVPTNCSEVECGDMSSKENCTRFEDPYGCCPIFQCPEEEKKGHCPRPDDIDMDTSIFCVSDFTCPGNKKCCKVFDEGFGYCAQPVQLSS